MSSGEVIVLNTKLDILIEDFKQFKKYAIGFVMLIVIPVTVYILTQLENTQMAVAILQTMKGMK